MSAFPMRRAFVGLKARYHLWSGRRAYRVGAFGDAWAHFHKVIEHGYESFEANLALGKIYLRRRDFRLASRFFRRARAIDSRRYLLEGFPDDFIQTLQSEMPPGRRPEYRITISTSGPPPREPSSGVIGPSISASYCTESSAWSTCVSRSLPSRL